MTETADEPPELEIPRLVDEEFILRLNRRGKEERRRLSTMSYAIIFFGALIAGLIVLLGNLSGIPMGGFGFLTLLLSLIWIVGYLKLSRLRRAFKDRRHDLTARYAASALAWNARCRPVTHSLLLDTLQYYLSLLLVEGRYLELEVISRYAWAVNEKSDTSGAIPKSWAIANNLAVGLLGQERFEDAYAILVELLPATASKPARMMILQNFALCALMTGRLSESEERLSELENLQDGIANDVSVSRTRRLRGMLELEKKNFEAAERLLTESYELAEKKQGTPETLAGISYCLSELRLKQERFDEAELLVRNSISAFESAPNPSNLWLAKCLELYARVMEKQGRDEPSRRARAKAVLCHERGIEKERATLAAISARLDNPKPIKNITALLETAERGPLLDQMSLLESIETSS